MNSLKIRTLCFFRTESVLRSLIRARSLSSCEGLNLRSSSTNFAIWSRSGSFLAVSLRPCTRLWEALHDFQHFLGNQIFAFDRLLSVQGCLSDLHIIEKLLILGFPSVQPLDFGFFCAVLSDKANSLKRRLMHDCSKANAELSKRLRNWIRINPTTCFWRPSSNLSSGEISPLKNANGSRSPGRIEACSSRTRHRSSKEVGRRSS